VTDIPEEDAPDMVDIMFIEYDWILAGEGKKYLEYLAQTSNTNLFSIEFIRHLIEFLWPLYRKAIIFKMLIPYLINFSAFCLHSTYVFEVR
jgi:hypothetical protein